MCKQEFKILGTLVIVMHIKFNKINSYFLILPEVKNIKVRKPQFFFLIVKPRNSLEIKKKKKKLKNGIRENFPG